MNEEEKQIIRKLQSDLIRIDNKERFFFNITNFEKMGLIKQKEVYSTRNARGNKERIRTDYYLTAKARNYINIIV